MKAEGRAGRMSAKLMAVVAEGDRRRVYLPTSELQERAAAVEPPVDPPSAELPDYPRAITASQLGHAALG